jgi:hypothetical protein
MKNRKSIKRLEVTFNGDVEGGSAVRGNASRRFFSKEVIMNNQLSKELDKDHLPLIISKVDAVAQALFLAYVGSREICDEEQFYRGMHWILDDAVRELKFISEQLCGDTSFSPKLAAV